MPLRDRACKNRVHAAIRFPMSKGPIDSRVVNFRRTRLIILDRQFLRLASGVEQLQNGVENLMKRQF